MLIDILLFESACQLSLTEKEKLIGKKSSLVEMLAYTG